MARARGKDKRDWVDCVQCWSPGTAAVKVPPGEECRRCGWRAPQPTRLAKVIEE